MAGLRIAPDVKSDIEPGTATGYGANCDTECGVVVAVNLPFRYDPFEPSGLDRGGGGTDQTRGTSIEFCFNRSETGLWPAFDDEPALAAF